MSILKVSIRQIKAAHALLDWSQLDLADAANVSIPTVKRLEADDGCLGGRNETATRIRTALERAGIEFLIGEDGSRGVRVALRKGKG